MPTELNGDVEMKTQKMKYRILTIITILIVMLVLLVSLTSCSALNPANWFKSAGEDAAKVIAQTIDEVISNLTGESEQWREEWQKTRTELPEDIRRQFDLAFENALSATGTEFRCDTDFILTKLKRDLGIISTVVRFGEDHPPISPQVCNVFPDAVLDLDANSRPKDQEWIRFAGYDFVDSNRKLNVKAVLEFKDGSTQDLTQCCVDSPTHYLLTVDFDEIVFANNHRRIVLLTNSGEEFGLSVAISHAPPPEPKPFPEEYWTDQFSEENPGEMTCRSGFAVAGLSCHGKYCDNKRLLCRPYWPMQDDERSSYWHSKVISEEQPNASFRTDILSQPGFVGGLGCSGQYCDNISFFVITTPHIVHTGQWEWKPFFSEESPGRSICAQNQFVTGVGCKGDYCDNISLHCSTVRFGN